jgi:hypothetical protein
MGYLKNIGGRMKCFVIMPFGDPKEDPEKARKLELIYSEFIKPSVESIYIPGKPDETISCHRADKTARPGEVITHIIENLVSADIVIADLSGRSPNVFYELGVRHSVNNNTILISDNLDDVPFDLRGLRTITYKWDPEQMLKLQRLLKDAITEILNEPDKIDNPVRRHLYNREIDKLIRQPAPPGYDVIKNILNEMSSLKKAFGEQTSEIRDIISRITIEKAPNLNNLKDQYNLKFFEGIWREEPTGILLYAKIVNNELLMPYMYGNAPLAPAHYYSCKLVGNTLFGRFEWLVGGISGYTYLKIKSDDDLVGGWRLSDDVPQEIKNNMELISETDPGMVPIKWKRIKEKQIEPKWIREYFKFAKSKGNGYRIELIKMFQRKRNSDPK